MDVFGPGATSAMSMTQPACALQENRLPHFCDQLWRRAAPGQHLGVRRLPPLPPPPRALPPSPKPHLPVARRPRRKGCEAAREALQVRSGQWAGAHRAAGPSVRARRSRSTHPRNPFRTLAASGPVSNTARALAQTNSAPDRPCGAEARPNSGPERSCRSRCRSDRTSGRSAATCVSGGRP